MGIWLALKNKILIDKVVLCNASRVYRTTKTIHNTLIKTLHRKKKPGRVGRPGL